jgi:hypothetical protein
MRTFAQLIDVLTAQKGNLGTYQTQVGATVGDMTQVNNMLGNLSTVEAWCEQVLVYKEAAFAIKQQLFDGDPALPVQPFPVAPATPALTAALSGGLSRQTDLNQRWRAAPGYTPAIGEALKIAGPATSPPDPGDVQPTIIVAAAKADYEFSVIVSGRERADSWTVSAFPVATGVRTTVGTGTGKSADFTYHPSAAEAGKPVQIRIEVQLRKNNADYGHPSGEERITVNP